MFWDLLEHDEKASVLVKILIHLAKVDGELSKNEFSYLVYVASKLHLPLEKVREIMISEEDLNEILPHDENERMNVLYHLLFMMEADKIIDPEEIKMIYHFALKLGFSEKMEEEFILIFKTYDIDDLPPDAMLKIIQKYQN